MAHRIEDRVQETTTSTGTGALTLAGAVSQMRSLTGAGFSNSDTFWGLILHATAAEWEISLCTYSGGAITRGTLLASSTGSAVSFSAGTKTISLVAPASKVPTLDNNGRAPQTSFIGLRGIAPQTIAYATTIAIDVSLGDRFKLTPTGNVTVINFSNLPTDAMRFMVDVINDGTARTFTWTAGNKTVYWPGDIPPVFTGTLNKRDRLVFDWDGTNVFGAIAGQGFAV